jgi:hypothetical protein
MCTPPHSTLMVGTPRPATSEVRIFTEEPREPYEVIALISMNSGGDLEKQKRHLQLEAAKLGADALIITIENAETWMLPAFGTYIAADTKKLTAKAIALKR